MTLLESQNWRRKKWFCCFCMVDWLERAGCGGYKGIQWNCKKWLIWLKTIDRRDEFKIQVSWCVRKLQCYDPARNHSLFASLTPISLFIVWWQYSSSVTYVMCLSNPGFFLAVDFVIMFGIGFFFFFGLVNWLWITGYYQHGKTYV